LQAFVFQVKEYAQTMENNSQLMQVIADQK
jgi:hypothetical protein